MSEDGGERPPASNAAPSPTRVFPAFDAPVPDVNRSPLEAPTDMSNIVPLSFEGKDIRVTDREGNPWFVLTDICRILEIGNPTMAAKALDKDERHTLNSVEGISDGRTRALVLVSESGFYTIALRCRDAMKPGSVPYRLRQWVTKEVLPSIRKTGGYGKPAINVRDPAQLTDIALQLVEVNRELQAELAVARPKVELLDELAGRPGLLDREHASKALRRPIKEITALMKEKGWIYQRPGMKHALGSRPAETAGYLTHQPTTIRATGETYMQVMLTWKGVIALGLLMYSGDGETLWPLLQHASASGVKLLGVAS